MSIRFSGINIFSDKPEELFDWYRGIGFVVDKEDQPGSEWYGPTFKLTGGDDGALLWVWRANGATPTRCQFVINCDDIQQTYRELKDKGYAVPEPEMQFYGGWEMPLKDPEGNTLLFLD